ncbi:MAG: hypothetical protein LBH22_06990 [Bacteroidales bacterium]|jgi:hypothetical protein|nr:hypothetical protein [Bacteroidales bacterium]
MKQIILIGLIILVSSSLFGQSTEQTDTLPRVKKQIVSLSYSPMFLSGQLKPLLDDINSYGKFGVIRGEYGVKAVYYGYENSGLFSLAYGRYIHKKIFLTMNLSYQQIWRKWDLYVDANSPHYFTERFHQIQVMPEVRYNYITTKDGSASLFLAAGVGLNHIHNNVGKFGDIISSRKGESLAYQVWLFGFQGKPIENIILHLHLGFGTRGFLEFGLGYRF